MRSPQKKGIKPLIKMSKIIKKRINELKKDIYISIGENCLSDDILSRNNLKSFSSPFSSGRSNIEYILAFEKENYADILNPEFLLYESDGNKKVARNKKYVSVENRYNESCMNGLEFTHHDIINDENVRERIKVRINRMLGLKNKRIVMLYHHRKCDDTDMQLLIHHLSELSSIYESRNNKVRIYLYYQIIVMDQEQRHVEYYRERNVYVFKFYTLKEWAGENQDVFWARCDDDMLKTMIERIKIDR